MNIEPIIHSKGQYINGSWIEGTSAAFKSINPATSDFVWEGHSASKDQISSAYFAASDALNAWANTKFDDRALIIKNFAKIVENNQQKLVQLISLETGKPKWESITEVQSMVAKADISIKAYQERSWPKEQSTGNQKACVRYKPQGVVVVLGAYNFPAHISNGHIVPALLAGNTVLYKPSEYTPGVTELIMQFWHESGIPKGVINCLQGGADVGQHLFDHAIQGVYFTGSYNTGLIINKFFASRPEVILALEMGGNNPLVYGEVDDIKAAVYNSIQSIFITAGQRCSCARRLIIPNSKHGEAFLEQLIHATKKMVIGGPEEKPSPFFGPVISNEQALKHLQKQDELIQAGGNALLTMAPLRKSTGFLSPGIIDMSDVSKPADLEIFAPLVQVYRYSDFDHAIALANQTRYGLTAGLMSDNANQYEQFYREVRAGLINWNRPTTGASSNIPFGGVGLSGNHRPSAYFAADYCSYPVASIEQNHLTLPETLSPGIVLD